MIDRRRGATRTRPLVVVHGHRDGNAVGGQTGISSECLARVRAAEHAVRTYRSELVLFCGAGTPSHPSEARQMAAIWTGPPVRGFLDECSADTAENAREARDWFHALGASALIVVSSWWHLRLRGYYGGRTFRDIPVHHVATRRCDRILGHLAHELRYAPRVWRLRNATARSSGAAPLTTAQRALALPLGAVSASPRVETNGREQRSVAG